jgi:hypothetical protein
MKAIYTVKIEFNNPVDKELLDQSMNLDIKNLKSNLGADNIYIDDVEYKKE